MRDEFVTETAGRCRWARAYNQGRPSNEWSVGEQLAVALVLRDKEQLAALGYTTEQAADHVCEDTRMSAFELTGWLNDVRDQLDTGDQA